jgi:hypothetical protein
LRQITSSLGERSSRFEILWSVAKTFQPLMTEKGAEPKKLGWMDKANEKPDCGGGR